MKTSPPIRSPAFATPSSIVWASGLVLACVFAAWSFHSLGGIEGDDLNVMFGMRNLDVMTPAGVYRYGWQPLAYDLFGALSSPGATPAALMAASAVLGALGFAGMVVAAVDLAVAEHVGDTTHTLRWAQAAVLVAVALPELWITALYFNTTALGFPFFVLALWLSLSRRQWLAGWRLGAAVGASFSIASLMRLDYATAGLLFLVLLQRREGRMAPVLGFLAALALAFGVYWALRPEWPGLIREILVRYSSEVFPGWSWYNVTQVFLAGFGSGLAVLALLMPASVWRRLAAAALDRWPVWGALLPMLLPAINLYSGKYLVPLACSSCLLMFRAWGDPKLAGAAAAPANLRLAAAWGVVAVLSVAGLTHPRDVARHPIGAWFSAPFPVDTHDGSRTIGFFGRTLTGFRHPDYAAPEMALARDIAAGAAICNTDLALSLSRGVWFWAPMLFELDRSRDWRLVDYRHEHSAVFRRSSPGPALMLLRGDQMPPAGFNVLDLRALFDQTPAELPHYLHAARVQLAAHDCTVTR